MTTSPAPGREAHMEFASTNPSQQSSPPSPRRPVTLLPPCPISQTLLPPRPPTPSPISQQSSWFPMSQQSSWLPMNQQSSPMSQQSSCFPMSQQSSCFPMSQQSSRFPRRRLSRPVSEQRSPRWGEMPPRPPPPPLLPQAPLLAESLRWRMRRGRGREGEGGGVSACARRPGP